jgi:GWxTD domain-containing protein
VSLVRQLLYPRKPNGAWTLFLAAVILIVTSAVTLSAWQSPPAHSPYYKWLHEDVVYIIDDAERAAFERLTTDGERNQFIEEFWLRRDPMPETPGNEFKEEHYRRIEFSNEHFAASTPGWQTDRGHMYILYGPPDEIESHPAGTKGPYATEVWLYHPKEGVDKNLFVTFVDKTGHGDFRVVPETAAKQ